MLSIDGKQLDNVQEKTLVVSATEAIVDKKHNRPLLLHKRRLTEENPRKVLVPGDKVLLEVKARKRATKILKGKCTDPSCDYWHPPACQDYKSVSGCKFGDPMSVLTH